MQLLCFWVIELIAHISKYFPGAFRGLLQFCHSCAPLSSSGRYRWILRRCTCVRLGRSRRRQLLRVVREVSFLVPYHPYRFDTCRLSTSTSPPVLPFHSFSHPRNRVGLIAV